MNRLIAILLAFIFVMSFPALGLAGIGSPEARVTVTCLRDGASLNDPDTQLVARQIETALEGQGIYIDLVMLEAPAGDYAVEVPRQMMYGQLAPDIVYFENDSDVECVAMGLLDDFTPYIGDSRNVAGLLEPHSKARLESWPYLLWLAPAEVDVPVIRSDLLDQASSGHLLRANPSVDSYLSALKELKDARVVEYGIAFDSIAQLDTIFNHAFGVTGTIMNVDGKFAYGCTTAANRDKLEFYAKLYAEGLISPDYGGATAESVAQDFYSGKAAIMAVKAGGGVEECNASAVNAHGPGAELSVLQPALGIGCSYLSVDVSKETRGFSISPYSDAKDASFAVLEYMASAEGRKLDLLGVEGTHYTVNPDGAIAFTPAHADYWPRFFPTLSGLPNVSYSEPLISNPARDSLVLAANYYAPDTASFIPPELKQAYDAAMALYEAESAKFISGERSIGEWDQFVEEFNSAGGAQLNDYITARLG